MSESNRERWNMGMRWLASLLMAAALGVAGFAPAPASADEAASEQAPSGVVNLNTASADELQRLPGVGPSKADAILKVRKRMGKFRHVRQIVRVRGIGRATYRKLQPMLTVEGNTTLK